MSGRRLKGVSTPTPGEVLVLLILVVIALLAGLVGINGDNSTPLRVGAWAVWLLAHIAASAVGRWWGEW